MIRITSKQPGFRRCNVAHAKDAVEYPDDKFSKEELKALRAEPMLVVEQLDGEPKAVGGSAAKDNEIAMADIVAAIGRLPVDNPDLWSASTGKPHVKSIENELPEGANIGSAQRDEGWEIFQKADQAGE
jgi:hypothetical protein